MNIEIIIRNATVAEAKELLAAIPEGTPVKVTRPDPPVPQPQDAPVEVVHARIVEVKKSKKQIPFLFKTQKKEYQNAWNLCNKWGLPYPEAIRKAESSTVTKETVKPIPSTIPAPVTMDTTPKSECIVGWKVRQIKADGQRFVKGIMMVTARKNGSGLIECLYEGKRHVIDAACLAIVERLPASA